MFAIKKALCKTHEFPQVIVDLEDSWVSSFLLRQGVPQLLLDRRAQGLTSNRTWKEYLFAEKGLAIYRHLGQTGVTIEICKYNEAKQAEQVVAEWSHPEVVYQTRPGERYVELRLKQWQLI